MTWNYRIVKYRDGSGWGVHEVYYDEEGQARAMTTLPVGFTAETKGELKRMLEMALDDAHNRWPFIEPQPDGWPVKEDAPYGKALER